jgi:hypothetical protein
MKRGLKGADAPKDGSPTREGGVGVAQERPSAEGAAHTGEWRIDSGQLAMKFRLTVHCALSIVHFSCVAALRLF